MMKKRMKQLLIGLFSVVSIDITSIMFCTRLLVWCHYMIRCPVVLKDTIIGRSSVITGHGLPPVTAGIGVWLDGVGQEIREIETGQGSRG